MAAERASAAVLAASARWEGSHIAVDPTISLQGNYPNPTQPQPLDLASIYGAALKIKQQQQQAQTTNALRAIFQQKDAIDPATGAPSPNALAAATRLNPELGAKLTAEAGEAAQRAATTAHTQSETQQLDLARYGKMMGDIFDTYDAEMQSGTVAPDIAERNVRSSLKDIVDKEPWSPEDKAQRWGVLSTLPLGQARALALKWSASPEKAKDMQDEEDKRDKRTLVDVGGETVAVGDEADPKSGALAATDLAGHPVDLTGKKVTHLETPFDPEKAAAQAENAKPTLLTDPNNNQQYWAFPPTRDKGPTFKSLTGEPYTPSGAAHVGSDAARSPAVMILQAFKHDFEDQNGRPPNAQELNDFNMNTQAQTKAVRDFATGPEGNQTRFNNVAVMHLELVKQYADALKNGDEQTINKLANQWKQEFGAAAPTNLDAVAQTAGQEVTKAVVPGAGGEAEREAAGKRFARYQSPEQFDGAINASIGLMGGQIKGLAQQYKQTTDRDDYGRLLLPDTKAAIYGQGILNLPVKLQNQWIYIPDQNKEAAKKKLQAAGYDVSDLH